MRRRFSKIALVTALVLGASAVPALASAGPSGSINGTVVALGTATPVAGATVNFMDPNVSQGAQYHVVTGPDGTFNLKNVQQGLYEVAAVSHGYAMPAPGYIAARLSSSSLTGVTVALKSGLSISGTLLDPLGKAIGGAAVLAVDCPSVDITSNVSLMNQSYFPNPSDWQPAYPRPFMAYGAVNAPGRTVSKPDGTFTIDGIVPGDYYVEAQSDGRPATSAARVTVAADRSVTGVRLRYVAGATLHGQLTHADGTAFSHVAVWLMYTSPTARQYGLDSYELSTTTDENGQYSFHDLPPTGYWLQTWLPGQLQMSQIFTLKSTVKAMGVNLHQTGSSRVSGYVHDTSGRPVAGVRVQTGIVQGRQVLQGFAYTNALGKYTVAGLSAGHYRLTIRGYPWLEGSTADANVDVDGHANSTSANFRMKYTGKITGTVKNADATPGFGAIVEISSTGSNQYGFNVDTTTRTEPDGSYEFDGLLEGGYKVTVKSLGQAASAPTIVKVNSGQATNADLQLQTLDHATVPGPLAPYYQWAYPAPEGLDVMIADFATDDGGSPITSYRVLVQPGNLSCTRYSYFGCRVDGLVSGKTYSVAVTPVNAVGVGPTTIFTSKAGPTDPVTHIVGKAAGRGRSDLSFVAPKTHHKIVNYKIETSPYAGAPWTTYAHPKSARTSRTLTGLTPKTTYLVRITPILDTGIPTTSKPTLIHTG
jgi:protocatechuate 3,4-dioxygenase beta subunit